MSGSLIVRDEDGLRVADVGGSDRRMKWLVKRVVVFVI